MVQLKFVPIYAGRSDGETELRTKKSGRVFNGPSNDQLDRVANPDDYYEPLDHDHAITLDWKRQLGGLLQRDLQAQAEAPWLLMFFPENYRLYKHNKDGRDSTQAYLYGYPQGRRKRFRSALDFYPHFLWLMEGKSEDPSDCACKNCAGEWVHKIEPWSGRQAVTPAAKVPKAENSPTKKSAKEVKPIKTTPLPAFRTKEQELDAQCSGYIHRLGELVWFNRGNAWGLAIILKRQKVKGASQASGSLPQTQYLVQPLSHPLRYPSTKIIRSNNDLRPWLAWSAPGPTHGALAGKTFSTIDWKAVTAGQYGSGDAEVDGSIFAAKQIDDSFSLAGPYSNDTTTTGERRYNVLFLGGEKIFLGDPVRIRGREGNEVLVLHEIIEKLKPNSTNINLASVFVVGDVYRLSTSSQPPDLAEIPHVPARMKADLEFRNRVTGPKRKIYSRWGLIVPAARLSVSDLKGRWYESSILLPILRGVNAFAAELQRGEMTEVGDCINGRGDATGTAGRIGTRHRSRGEAFGKAVSPNVKLDTPEEKGEGGISDV